MQKYTIKKGKQRISIKFDKYGPTWAFCQNGYHSTDVNISVEQFDMLKNLTSEPAIVEHYEKLRGE